MWVGLWGKLMVIKLKSKGNAENKHFVFVVARICAEISNILVSEFVYKCVGGLVRLITQIRQNGANVHI